MARGWESKSVEMQVESAAETRSRRAEPGPTAEQMAKVREIDGLELSRTRILNDLGRVENPRYKSVLRASLDFLDEKLKRLQ